MNDSQRNKLNMYVLVRDFLLASVTITNKIVVFAALFATFTDYVNEIFAVSEQQERNNTGVTKTKKSTREALIQQMLKISRKCVGYASGVEDLVFLQLIRYGESELKHMADADLAKKAEDMPAIVGPKLADLAGYNITEDDLTALIGFTKDFVSIYTAPVGNKKTKAKFTEKLNLLVSNTDGVLEKMDDQVGVLYDTDPEFCDEYNRKRKIVKLAKRKRAFQMWIVDDETGLPIGKAIMKTMKKDSSDMTKTAKSSSPDLSKIVKIAGARGGVINNTMEAGEYTYEVSLGGYITETGTFFINEGLMTEVRVRMRKSV